MSELFFLGGHMVSCEGSLNLRKFSNCILCSEIFFITLLCFGFGEENFQNIKCIVIETQI